MRAIVALLLVAACGGGSPQTRRIPGDKEPAITVEVLNASGRAGDARIATRRLREAGIDVVFFGNAPPGSPAPPVAPASPQSGAARALDTTRIIVRRGTVKTGERVRDALGIAQGRVVVQLDGSKLLDVSVLLGSDFAASARGPRDLHP